MIKTEAEFFEAFNPLLERSGLKVLSTEVKSYDEGVMEIIPNLTIAVSLEGTTSDTIYRTMKGLELAFNKLTKSDIRTGYYDAEIGYDEIPAGVAHIEIDCLPFFLEPKAPTAKM